VLVLTERSHVAASDNDTIREGECKVYAITHVRTDVVRSRVVEDLSTRSAIVLPAADARTGHVRYRHVVMMMTTATMTCVLDSEHLITMDEKDINPKFVQKMNLLSRVSSWPVRARVCVCSQYVCW
jgi:hypothetical protein